MTNTSSTIYSLGRPVTSLSHPYSGTDKTYGAERHDHKTINSADYKHCTFVNLGFKETIFRDSQFLNCIFVGCYFRHSELRNCNFTGCKFVECDFEHITLRSCEFRYSRFRDCHIKFQEIEYSLPREPNLREDLCRNLSIESWRLGLSQQAKLYRTAELQSREEHLSAAVFHGSQWYVEHFGGKRRFRALIDLTVSRINRWLWGYGLRIWRLVVLALILPLFVFPGIFLLSIDHLAHRTKDVVGIPDLIVFSLGNFLPTGLSALVVSDNVCIQIISGLESLVGVVVTALFAAYIFRWILHR